MSHLEYKYDIFLDDIKKKSIKRLKIEIKNNYQLTNVSKIFIIKPKKKYKEQYNQSFSDNVYDLSFSDISQVEFRDDDFDDMKLVPGIWHFGWSDTEITHLSQLNDIKKIYIPYRDFLFNNNAPFLERDNDNLNTLFFSINNNELLRMKSILSENMFAFGKKSLRDDESLLKIFFENLIWLPSDEKTYDSTGWDIFSDYKGINDERLQTIPTYYNNAADNIVLYSGLNNFNEPGFNYNNTSIKSKTFFKNVVAKYTTSPIQPQYWGTKYEQYHNFQNETNIQGTFSSIEGKISIENWESTIYIPDNIELINSNNNNSGIFGFSEDGTDTSFLMGIRGTGYDNIVDGYDNYVFIDASGGIHKLQLQNFGIKMNAGRDGFLGGFTIKYKIRKNINNLFDVYIFINDIFAKKVKDRGIPLEKIKYFGRPQNYNSLSIKGVSFLYESIKVGFIEDIFHKDNNVVKWKTRQKSKKYSNDLLTIRNSGIFQFSENNSYPVSFKESISQLTGTNVTDIYIFEAGPNNKFYIDVYYFNFYNQRDNVTKDISNNFLIIECSNDTTIDQNTNWTIPQIEWMHKKDISDNISVAETDFIDLSFNQSSTTIVSSDPIRFKNEINFDYSNGPYTQVFDAGENRQIIIEVSGNVFDLSENAHPDTFLKQNKLILEISDISGAWTVPNIEWMYKDISSSNQIPGNITDISFVSTLHNTSHSSNIIENQVYKFIQGDTSDEYSFIFNAGVGNTVSLEFIYFDIEGSDSIQILGSNNNTTYTDLQVYWMKDTSDYNGNFNGNYIPPELGTTKNVIYKNSNSTKNIYLHTQYRYIKFDIKHESSSVWDIHLFRFNDRIIYDGNIFPKNIPNTKHIITNKRYAKINYDGSGNYNTDSGFQLKIFTYSELENKHGNIFPRSIENAKKMTGLNSFHDFNRIVLDCSYVKFTYRQEDINNNTFWDIIINVTEEPYYDISFNNITSNIFSEDNGFKTYPVKFYNDENIDLGTYHHTFDAGENNTVNILFRDFSFNHIISNNSGLDNDFMTIMISSDNNNWLPLSHIWMHKNVQPDPISGSGLIPQGDSWIEDKNGFIIPKDKETALKMFYELNTIDANTIDISFNKINKLKTNYRYLKISYKTDGNNNGTWDFRIFIKKDIGIEHGLLTNKNNINLYTENYQIDNICSEFHAYTYNKNIFEDSYNFTYNNKQIPFISRYDYILKDISNNFLLKSQIDTDILYTNIESDIINYNSKRTCKELNLMNNTLNENDIRYDIVQRYKYNARLLNIIRSEEPYIPGLAEINFIYTQKKVFIQISNQYIENIKANLITYWNGDITPTYIKFIIYIWYPFSNNIPGTGTVDNNIISDLSGSDLSGNLILDKADEIIEIDIPDNKFYTVNSVGIPSQTSIEYIITEFTGKYIFTWTYKVFQPNGSYNNITPMDITTYSPYCNVVDLVSFLRDDFIYDPLEPLIEYTDISSNLIIDPSNNYEKITISLSDTDITAFNEFIKKYQRNLSQEQRNLSQENDYEISDVKIIFYIWTPNNEISTNTSGWELPSDYFGPTDPRITVSPYRFSQQLIQNNSLEINWDPSGIVNNKKEFGFNIGANGTIKKEFTISPTSNGDIVVNKETILFDLSHSEIINNSNYNTQNKKIPNPYKYKKNNVFGVPYISRWGYEINTTKPIDTTQGNMVIESRVKQQTGDLGDLNTDFNFNFKFNSNYYLELDKQLLQNYPGLKEFKNFSNTGLNMGFITKQNFLVAKINDVFWQIVIKIPPVGYVFDSLDENGNFLETLEPVTPGNNIFTSEGNLKYSGTIQTSMVFNQTEITFNESDDANAIASDRKYVLYIRKSTEKEKNFMDSFTESNIIQFENQPITTRLSDWYPLAINYQNTTNQYKYGTLFNTDSVILDEIIENIVIEKKDPCDLCKDITKTKEINNAKIRYAKRVNINFNLASRITESCR
jgi:hypothetical protein